MTRHMAGDATYSACGKVRNGRHVIRANPEAVTCGNCKRSHIYRTAVRTIEFVFSH